MKKVIIALLFAVFLTSVQCFSGEGKALAVHDDVQSSDKYQELGRASQRGFEGPVVALQPQIEVKRQVCSACSSVRKGTDFCCDKYVKATFIACALALADKAIFLGLL